MRVNTEQAHAKGKLPMDHGVWWMGRLLAQANNFLLCRRLDSSKLVVSEYAVVQAQWPNDRAGRSPRLPTRRRTEIHSVPEADARLICVSKHLPVRLERRSRLFSPFLKQSRIVLQL